VLILFFIEITSTMAYIYSVQLIEYISDSVYESLTNLSLTLDTARFLKFSNNRTDNALINSSAT
jgi:hypothetical protein